MADLNDSISENDATDRPLRQVTYLLSFLSSLLGQLRGKACSQAPVQSAVRQLIVLAASTSQPVMASTDIPSNLHKALASTMLLLSADNFLGVTAELLSDGSEQDIIMSLGVFAERLPLIKSEVRLRCTKVIAEILKRISGLLAAPRATVNAALEAVKSVTKTAIAQEDGALAGVLPAVVGCIGKVKDSAVIVAALLLIELLV